MISDIVSHMLQGDEVFIPEEVKVDVMNNLYAAIQKNWSKKRNEGLDESEMIVTNEEKPRSNAPRDGVDVNVGDTVTIFGEDPTVSELAGILGTIPYEILTSVPRRIERIVVK